MELKNILDIDYEKTVKNIDFTMKAARGINQIISAQDLEDMDPEIILAFLLKNMEMVPFHKYLKRYICQKAGLVEEFDNISDQEYQYMIMETWEKNRAPHSFTPTKVPWKTMVKRWLTQDSVQRSTVFLLGFGLKMSDIDVSEFLTKVLKESDFDLEDPIELIYWYCFCHGLPYAKAVEYQNHPPVYAEQAVTVDQLRVCENEKQFLVCLTHCKEQEQQKRSRLVRYERFRLLYQDCQETVAELLEIGTETKVGSDEVRAIDFERIICEGIPMTEDGNRRKMSESMLKSCFDNKRLTRQRLVNLEKGKLEVGRYDLITLQFLISSQTEDENAVMRCRYFLEDINDILQTCGMMEYYPANPYEAFILICLLTDLPLATYSDVWKLSYQEGTELEG